MMMTSQYWQTMLNCLLLSTQSANQPVQLTKNNIMWWDKCRAIKDNSKNRLTQAMQSNGYIIWHHCCIAGVFTILGYLEELRQCLCKSCLVWLPLLIRPLLIIIIISLTSYLFSRYPSSWEVAARLEADDKYWICPKCQNLSCAIVGRIGRIIGTWIWEPWFLKNSVMVTQNTQNCRKSLTPIVDALSNGFFKWPYSDDLIHEHPAIIQ